MAGLLGILIPDDIGLVQSKNAQTVVVTLPQRQMYEVFCTQRIFIILTTGNIRFMIPLVPKSQLR